ncbi:HPr family phosphocarrier protein [Gorillibacterium sp. sgz500922]|uniref:HPr family phosphocarrier protein n=1 Tax=Gorillibacterium sp. sgz500922 TaxID=3446694 RepID=UPI003F67CC25
MQSEHIILNPNGIHARPARKIVTTASGYGCSVFLEKDSKRVNAKSLVGVLTLGGKQGDRIRLIAEGEDAEQAAAELGAILEAVWDEKAAGE